MPTLLAFIPALEKGGVGASPQHTAAAPTSRDRHGRSVACSSRTMIEERRGSPRSYLDCNVMLMSPAGSWAARLKTLSRLGALVLSDSSFPIGAPVNLVFDSLFELRGQVVRTEAVSNGVEVGVMFAPLSSSTVEKLDSLIAGTEVR